MRCAVSDAEKYQDNADDEKERVHCADAAGLGQVPLVRSQTSARVQPANEQPKIRFNLAAQSSARALELKLPGKLPEPHTHTDGFSIPDA